jgi:hypothetical protein
MKWLVGRVCFFALSSASMRAMPAEADACPFHGAGRATRNWATLGPVNGIRDWPAGARLRAPGTPYPSTGHDAVSRRASTVVVPVEEFDAQSIDP